MGRGRAGAIAASPTLVGAITTLIVILAVFLAYNANNGLPFVPSYRISVQVPNANTLVPGNDVRIGGVQVGFVEEVVPVQDPQTGAVHAKVDLKLNKSVDPLPKDSSVVVRAKSALGLKYLEINKGTSKQGYPEGSVLSLKAAHPHPVEIDTVLNTFDPATRHAAQENLVAFGDALAGRGADLNAALGEFQPLVAELEPVARNLASKKTGLGKLFQGLENAAAEVAPVAQTQADMFVALDSTFAAFARVARPFIQDTISETPPTLDTLTRTSPRIRSFLGHSATLFAALRPGIKALSDTSPEVASAFETGARVLPDSPQLNEQLAPTFQTLAAFGKNAGVNAGIDRSTQLFKFLTPTLRFVAPAQTFCHYPSLLFRNGQDLLSLGDGVGTWQRFQVFSAGQLDAGLGISAPNSENSPSDAPANGPKLPLDNPINFLHSNPYPYTAAPGQPHACAAGNEDYSKVIGKVSVGNPPLLQKTTKGPDS
jgi:virulence factor Mce-like protein